jgi:hypothetical protein
VDHILTEQCFSVCQYDKLHLQSELLREDIEEMVIRKLLKHSRFLQYGEQELDPSIIHERGLLEKHKLIVATMLCLKILERHKDDRICLFVIQIESLKFSDTFSDLFSALFINWSVANLTIVIISSFFRLFVFLALSITAALLALLIVFSAGFFFLLGAFFFSTFTLSLLFFCSFLFNFLTFSFLLSWLLFLRSFFFLALTVR